MSDSDKQSVPLVEEVKWEWTTESRISTVIGLLPASLQSRMVPFRRPRRSASLGNLRTVGGLTSTTPQKRPASMGGTGTPTGTVALEDRRSQELGSPKLAVVSRGYVAKESAADGSYSSGIHWRVASQGMNLVGLAADASTDDCNGSFERKAFIDGLSYLLRSMPQDLEPIEVEQIRNALPPTAFSGYESMPSGAGTPDRAYPLSKAGKSTLHRLVQALVLNLFLLIHFLLPYLIVIIKSAAGIERRYKVSERMVGHGMSCFNAAGRYGAKAAEVIAMGGEGREVGGSFVWTVEEVTRGVSDGVGEGIVLTRLRDEMRASTVKR